MAKFPNKQDELQAKVLQEWLFILKILDDVMVNIGENGLAGIEQEIIRKSLATINTDNRLASHDESIYNYYTQLMSYYGRAIEMYNDNKDNIKSEKVKSILEGLHSVLMDRLKLSEERYEEEEDESNENPIAIEKAKIIQNNADICRKNLHMLCEQLVGQHGECATTLVRQNLYENMSYQNMIIASEEIINTVDDKSLECLYKIYVLFIKSTIHNLNDMSFRKITAYYHDLLKEEQEIMYSIIKIQIMELESEIEKNNTSPEEKTILFNMLSNLREGYQYLGKQIKEIMECFVVDGGNKDDALLESQGQFFQMIRQVINMEDLITPEAFENAKIRYDQHAEKFQALFVDLINTSTDKIVKGYNLGKQIYVTRKSILEVSFITAELISVFKQILTLVSPDNLNEDSKAIVDGIRESVEIKIDTLEEVKQTFMESSNNALKQLESVNIKFTEDDRLHVLSQAFEIWRDQMLRCPLEEDRAVTAMQRAMNDIQQCHKLSLYGEKSSKKNMSNIDGINKKILNYKKEHLLFEISTFEEIMNYSVQRLRSDDNLADYVNFMDNIVVQLENILKKNDIELIKPRSHDMFNGKEHEVLLAEKRDGFTKGEIIKLMNCGYKQNNVVLLRANVIASK